MNLTGLKVDAFIEKLGSDAPAPGGGSASALAGAVGISLTRMVAALTLGKEKYREHDQLMVEIMQKSEKLQEELLFSIDRDTEAFNGVTAVFSMPKETDQEKELRKVAMQLALQEATVVPFRMMGFALEALELTKKAVGKSNTNAASDLGVASLTLKAAVQGAWLNVLINLGGIKDEVFVQTHKTNGEAILKKALPMADEIYQEILGSL
jgi:formiminotetrahydrofolate cyclodeaminase